MEGAPLRTVHSTPNGPVDPAEAVRYVTAELPGLDEPAAAAFALVILAGQRRPELGESAEAGGLSGEALGDALARARKALRRKLHPLPGSGWCERAERLISDRLDDALEDPGPARLEVHLANCGRCVEHERRLGEAQDALVGGFAEAQPAQDPGPAPDPVPPPPVLRAVETPALPPPSSATEALPAPAPDPPALPSAQPGPATPPRTPAAPAAPAAHTPPSLSLAAPTVPSTPPPAPPSDPPAPKPSARAQPSQSPSPVPSESPSPVPPPPPLPVAAPAPWRSDTPRPVTAARTALETESTWTALGPLVAVLSVAVMVALLACVLTLGG